MQRSMFHSSIHSNPAQCGTYSIVCTQKRIAENPARRRRTLQVPPLPCPPSLPLPPLIALPDFNQTNIHRSSPLTYSPDQVKKIFTPRSLLFAHIQHPLFYSPSSALRRLCRFLRSANVRVMYLCRKLQTRHRLLQVSLQRRDHDEHERLAVAPERVLEEVCQLDLC
jgi:hypothetical protein